MDSRSYVALFRPSGEAEGTDVGVKASKQSSIPTTTKKVKESPFQKLQRLPDGCHCDFDNDHLYSVNNLREFWHKSQGAAFVDDKEGIMKTVLFIISVLPDVCQPFLVVTTASLSLWEAEFNRLAPSINVVVYDGDKYVRKSILDLEFNENGSNIMLHVLLAHPDAILEDIETLKCKSWEAVIVDYCQNSVLKLPKQLSTDFRMVLLSSPLKDNLLEYKNLLAFLNSQEEDSGDHVDDSALAILRARFTRHVAYERKANSSKKLEYWVPAYLSRVQLQLYSSILLTNSSVLQSQISTDSVGALRDIILCLWKCCDHPCIIDEFPQNSLVNIDDATESIDNKMRASGKLLLLEKMLKEIKNKRSRVIVLFQSGENQMGNILEDFVRHRFGPESYERVQNRSPFSRRKEAMSMFNDMTKGRFVFLIESHACHSSIYLSSIDAIIIYGSNWNPLNDLKALGKIKIESQLEYVNIFRLYTPFTVEEKGLVLAKQGMIIDRNIQDTSLSHSLLSWGVSFLFNILDELQLDNPASKSSEWGTVYMDKVISELTGLSTNVEDSTKLTSATISKVYMSGEFYSRNITLVGEREEGVSSLDGDPPSFWFNLLDGKSPWHNMSESPQVRHINLQNMEKPANAPAEETDKARRKRRKTGVEKLSTPKSLHVQLKCELSKLIKVLKLPDNVRFLAEQFLEYFLKNHLVMQKPHGILHALNIALCWRAASLLKYTKLDRRESLALAADCLNYEYNEELTGFFYKKLGTLKKKVVHKPGGRNNKVNDGRFSSQESSSPNLRSDHMFPKQAMGLHGNFTNGTPQDISSDAEQMVSNGQELVSSPEADREWHLSSEEPPNMTVKKRIDLFNKVFSLRENNLHEKQQLEILELRTQRENQVIKLKDVCHLVVQHIRRSDIDEETISDQIKLTIQWFTMLVYAFLEHMRLQLDKLVALQSGTWFEERLMKEKLKQEVISGQLDQSHDLCITIPDSNFVIEEFIHFKEQNDDHHDGEILVSGFDQLLEVTLVPKSVPSEAFSTRAMRNEPAEALVRSGRGAASESVDLPESSIHCNSDGIDLQRACCSSAIPASHDSINQESSTGESRGIEHAKRDNIVDTSMFPGGPTSLVVGLNDGPVAADPVHLESPISASPQSLATLSMSREVGTDEANLSNMSAQQTVGTLQHPPAEVEPTNTLHVMAARDLQTEMQTSWSALDASPQRMCPDDSSQLSLEPDTPTGLLQEGTASYHLGDASIGVKHKSVDIVAADADSCQTGHQPETTPDLSRGGGTYHHLVYARLGADVNNNATVCADQAHSTSPTFAVPQSPAVLPFSSEVGPCANLSSTSSQQSNDSPSRHPPAVAESTGMLGTQAELDLHPDMQPSTSLLDIPLQRMSPDDRSQTGCRPVRATNPSEECGTEYPTCATHNVAALPLSREAEADIGQTSMPAQESTIPHAQQSLATWQHPPEEAESAGILGMVPADDLQPSTSMLDQTAQAEQSGMLSTAAAQDLQSEMQPSTTTQDVPLESDLSGMPVTQSTTVLQCVEPSCDPHAGTVGTLQSEMQLSITTQDVPLETDLSGMPVTQSTTVLQGVEPSCDPHAETAGTLGMVAAPDLHPEMQPSSSTQDQPAEAEGAGTLGTIAAHDLQPETQPSTSVQDILPERIHPDERIEIGRPPNTTSGPEQLTQLLPVALAASNHLICSSEPLRNELERLKYCQALLSKQHENKKSLLQTAYNQELEKLNRKYELLHEKEDSAYHRMTTELDDIYRKVFRHQSLAENFRENLTKSPASQERSASPTIGRAPQSSQQAAARTSVAQTTTSPVASSLATRPLVFSSFHATGPSLEPSQMARPPSEAIQLQANLPGYPYRGTPSPLSSMPPRHGSYGAAGAQPRGPAAHLRMPSPYATVGRYQQQLAVSSPGITSLRQSAPGILESFASTSPLAGVAVTSMASSSVHQTMTSAPNSHPAFHSMSGPLNAAAGIWHGGGHISGVGQPVPESALFQGRWHPAMAGALLASMASGSVHQTMTSASNSHPGLPASSPLSGPLPRELMANLMQFCSGTNPALMATQQARAGRAAGGPAGTGGQRGATSGEVVCLSDDEE